jgi:hypothetical protein
MKQHKMKINIYKFLNYYILINKIRSVQELNLRPFG